VSYEGIIKSFQTESITK